MNQPLMQAQMNDVTSARRRPVPVVETPQSLVLICMQEAYRSLLGDLLQRAGFSGNSGAAESAARQPVLLQPEPLGSIGEWHEWLAEHPKAHVLLLVALPSVAVARRLQQGSDPNTALADWIESAQGVLDVIRSQRRRISLVFSESALAAPQAFIAVLAKRLQVTLRSVAAEQLLPDWPEALLLLMAENAIRQSANARNIAAELDANALPLPDSKQSRVPSIDEVFYQYRSDIDSRTRAAQELREENKLLLEQLQDAQENAKVFAAEKKALEDRLKSLDSETKAREKPTSEIKGLQEENELLLQQLHHVQEELERYYVQSMQTQDLSLQHSPQLEAAHETILAIYNSYSWRLTWPLRLFLRILGAGTASSKKAPLPDSIEAAEAAINALYKSMSWKVTKPLRALAGSGGKNQS